MNIYKNLKVKLPKVRVATGLFSNWDSFVKVDRKVLDWIKSCEKKKPNGIVLKSIEEVAYILEKTKEKSEHLISKDTYEKLNSLFKKRKKCLGGNGNNMGRILFELGLRPLVSYPCRPRKLMLASPNFKVALENKLVNPKKAIREKDPNYEHIIFQFKDYRKIFSWDLMSFKGIFDYDFLKFACNKKFTDILILGFAHLILPKYKKRIDEIVDFLSINKPKVHLEFGVGCKKSMEYAIKKFSDNNCVDSFGLDEKECIIYFKAKSNSKEDLIEATLSAIEKYGVKRICLHTSNFALSISKNSFSKEFESLSTACLVASAKTFGKLNFRKARNLQISKENVVKKRIDGYNFCFLPTLKNPEPKIITGVGDFFAAVQAVKALS